MSDTDDKTGTWPAVMSTLDEMLDTFVARLIRVLDVTHRSVIRYDRGCLFGKSYVAIAQRFLDTAGDIDTQDADLIRRDIGSGEAYDGLVCMIEDSSRHPRDFHYPEIANSFIESYFADRYLRGDKSRQEIERRIRILRRDLERIRANYTNRNAE